MKKIWLIVVLGIVGMLLLATAGCDGKDTISYRDSQQTGISVSGQGKVSAVPDLATISLGIEAQATTVSEARNQAADAMGKVMKSLKDDGVAEKDIQTSQFNISPVREWNRETGKETLLGYRVTNMVSVKIRDLGKVGPIIDTVAEAGGDFTQVQGISFSVEDPKPYQQQAREEALADAKAKADQMASLTGVELGQPISISESGGYYSPIYLSPTSYAKDEASVATTPISAGEQEISVSVQILYEIN